MRQLCLTTLFAVSLSGCGGAGSSPAPTPTPTPTPVNHSPSISSLSVSPGFGISQLTTFAGSAAASDQDGDAVTYNWEFGDGATGTGTSANHVYPGAGTMTVKMTVKDPQGASTSDTRSIVVGGMTGSWHVDITNFVPLRLDLTQTGGTVTGTFTQLEATPVTPAGTTGKTDPAEPGKIDASGKIEIRFKVSVFLDFYLRGTMDQTGRKITGGVFGSGFTGDAFTAEKL